VTYRFDLQGSATGQGTLQHPLIQLLDSTEHVLLSDLSSGGFGPAADWNSQLTYAGPVCYRDSNSIWINPRGQRQCRHECFSHYLIQTRKAEWVSGSRGAVANMTFEELKAERLLILGKPSYSSRFDALLTRHVNALARALVAVALE
jgi:hypothetical protein